MTTDPWNNKSAPLDWSEQVEEELRHGPLPQDTSPAAFPTLSEAAKTVSSKPLRKKKGQQQPSKMSLGELFSTGGGGGTSAYGHGGGALTDHQIALTLPTRPREKDPSQPQSRNWGGRHGGFPREREERGGGFSRDRSGADDSFAPSRADESKNWGADRRGPGGGRNYDRPPSRGSSRGGYEERDGGGGRYSRVNDSDDWTRENKFQPSSGGRYGGGGGFEGDRSRRVYGFHSGAGGYQPHTGGSDRWSQRSARSTPPPSDAPPSQGRPRLDLAKRTKPLPEMGATPDVAAPARAKPNPFGQAKPREEVLKERATSDVISSKSDIASDQEYRSQPGSPGGSCRGSSVSVSGTEQSARGEVAFLSQQASKPREDPFGGAKPREDPFGGAKPREVVLNERGGSGGGSSVTNGFDKEHAAEICSSTT